MMTKIRCKLGSASWTGVTPSIVAATEMVTGCPQYNMIKLAQCRGCKAFLSEEA
jgi:hypothetical protein